jgi:hypothetical protein
VSGSDEESEATREKRLRRAVASVAGFELRKQDDGKRQIVFISSLTGAALPVEDGLTLDDVQWWVDENVPMDEH